MWDWGNDESIQEAQLTSYKQINIRAKLYKGLILSGLPYIQMKIAEKINNLSAAGMNLIIRLASIDKIGIKSNDQIHDLRPAGSQKILIIDKWDSRTDNIVRKINYSM